MSDQGHMVDIDNVEVYGCSQFSNDSCYVRNGKGAVVIINLHIDS